MSNFLLSKNIRTLTQFQALAYEQNLKGEDDLAEFLIGRSPFETSLDMKEAEGKIERTRQ